MRRKKSAVYTVAIQDGILELGLAARDPAVKLTVTGEDALQSLRMAVQAEQFSP